MQAARSSILSVDFVLNDVEAWPKSLRTQDRQAATRHWPIVMRPPKPHSSGNRSKIRGSAFPAKDRRRPERGHESRPVSLAKWVSGRLPRPHWRRDFDQGDSGQGRAALCGAMAETPCRTRGRRLNWASRRYSTISGDDHPGSLVKAANRHILETSHSSEQIQRRRRGGFARRSTRKGRDPPWCDALICRVKWGSSARLRTGWGSCG